MFPGITCDAMSIFQTRRIVKLRRLSGVFSILAVIIVCLTVAGAVACEFHPASSEHEREAPAGCHQGGQAAGASCLSAILPENVVFVELATMLWVAPPVRFHIAIFASPPYIPPRSTTR